jgi:hypothetical protein
VLSIQIVAISRLIVVATSPGKCAHPVRLREERQAARGRDDDPLTRLEPPAVLEHETAAPSPTRTIDVGRWFDAFRSSLMMADFALQFGIRDDRCQALAITSRDIHQGSLAHSSDSHACESQGILKVPRSLASIHWCISAGLI